ncbi:hypothetical protein GCM10010124_23410 [Pilimelia terevasa]|uniref:Uncharacterized protein n=1 Tax=Pilimelia terevasa TaxID=53372 RepID=A0A8J3BLL1_9ACTN|nr:peptidase [Pilimelia terevasa]GGK29974.1 hypothetical protein GCM10010124_23410 [Pilimelia terevasa]
MRFLRVLLPALAVLAFAAPAAAAPYPAEPPPAQVSTSTIGSGGTVTFSASGFLANERVSITVTYRRFALRATNLELTSARRDVIDTVIANGSGSISVPVTLHTPGTATITATGLVSGVTVSTTVTVLGGAGEAGLPVTGGTPGGLLRNLLLGGVGAVLLGAWLVAWMLRRRRTVHAPA